MVAAVVCVLLARAIRMPTIVAYILAGLALGPATGILDATESADLIAETGIVLLLFLVGLGLSLDKIRDVGRVAVIAGLGQVVFTAAGGFLLGTLLGFSPIEALFIATALTFSSTVVVIDDDPEVIARLRPGEVPCIRGDASDPEVLRAAGADRAKLISSTVRHPRDNARLLEGGRGVPAVVRVFDEEDARWVEERGGIAVLSSEAAAEEFRRWFTRRRGPQT